MMMFTNMVLCDIKIGIWKRWKLFLFSSIMFSLLAVFARVDFDAALRMEPSPIRTAVTLGDYFCYLFGGTSAGNLPIEFVDNDGLVNAMFHFNFPSIWALTYLVLLLITLQYPYEDLMGFGKNIIVLSGRICDWWLSKCIWTMLTVVLYFLLAFGCFSTVSLLLGAEGNLNIGTYYPYFRFDSPDFITDPPWNIVPTLLMQIPVGIGLCVMQLTFSVATSRLASYLICVVFLLASAYTQHSLLFPNISMFARNIDIVTNGLMPVVELIVIAWFAVVSILVGYIYLKYSDILNKNR